MSSVFLNNFKAVSTAVTETITSKLSYKKSAGVVALAIAVFAVMHSLFNQNRKQIIQEINDDENGLKIYEISKEGPRVKVPGFSKGEYIGDGGNGTVFIAKQDGKKVLKKIEKLNDKKAAIESAMTEARIGHKIGGHPNFVKTDAIKIKEGDSSLKVKIRMERAEGVVAHEFFLKHNGTITVEGFFYILDQAYSAMMHLDAHQIEWNDVDDKNIMINPADKHITFIDYGCYMENPDPKFRMNVLMNGFFSGVIGAFAYKEFISEAILLKLASARMVVLEILQSDSGTPQQAADCLKSALVNIREFALSRT